MGGRDASVASRSLYNRGSCPPFIRSPRCGPRPARRRRVASVPYDVVNTDEARALAAGNPLSFLHVSRPEIDLPAGADPHADEVYTPAAESFAALRQSAPLVVERRASFYVYRLHMGEHVQSGVAACFSIDEYDRDLIKKHEKTRPDKEDDRTRHMLAIGAQTGPVFLTYRAIEAALDAVVRSVEAATPLFDFTAPDGVRHVSSGGARAPRSQAIVDGVRRGSTRSTSPTATIARRARRGRAQALAAKGAGEHDRVLAVAFPDNQMQVLPYNRVVRTSTGLTPEAFLQALGRSVHGARGRPGDRRRSKGADRDVPRAASGTRSTSKTAPDDARRRRAARPTILEPLLGIKDVRTDKRIDFVGGIRGTEELERLVDSRRPRRGVLAVPGVGRRPDAHRRRRRHHAAEVDLVRTEAARRLAVARHRLTCALRHR